MRTERKSLVAVESDAVKGTATFRIAQFGVIDKDNDVTHPGFFGQQAVHVLPAHDWGHVPIGKGMTYEDDDFAYADVKFNMDIEPGRLWHSAIAFDAADGNPIQEYSYGFDILDGGSHNGEFKGSQVRHLHAKDDGSPGAVVHEVSPVIAGAGIDTGTVAVKGRKFSDELDEVLDAFGSTVERAKALAALRNADGRSLGTATIDKIKRIYEMAGDLWAVTAPVDIGDVLAEMALFERQRYASVSTRKE